MEDYGFEWRRLCEKLLSAEKEKDGKIPRGDF